MASMGIHSALPKLSNPAFLSGNKPSSAFLANSLSSSLSITNATRRSQEHALRALLSASSNTSIEAHPLERHLVTHDSSPEDSTCGQKIDSWMEKSVVEIVKNLKKAPLLVQIYGESDGGVKIHAGEAVPEEWATLHSDWRSGDVKSPDGLIFVEELEHECDHDHDDGDRGNIGVIKVDEGVTRAWGICVQGRGVETGPACYLLKTNRVCGGIGLGFCTHFCLMRVRNFRDSAFEQFKDSWLLR